MSERPRQLNVRVLDIAEQITTLVEANIWTRTNFPPQRQVQRRLGVGRELIATAFQLLVDRGVLCFCLDREVSSMRRYLPATESRAHEPESPVDHVAAAIEDRIVSGAWTAESFPNLRTMSRQLECRGSTASAALRRLESRGLVRRAKVVRTWRWIPARHPEFSQLPLHMKLMKDIQTGRWTGPLPTPIALARHYHVHTRKMTAALERLEAYGLVRRVWLPDFTRRVWYVMNADAPAGLAPGHGPKEAAIIADLVRRLPEWADVDPSGRITARRALPSVTHLRRHYHCHYTVTRTALDALVLRGVLERVETEAQPQYLPLRVPLRGFPEGIPAASRRAGIARLRRPWMARTAPHPPATKAS